MIDIKNKRCIYEDCKKQPQYNTEGETRGLYCAEHRKDNMVNIKSKRCNYEGCKKHPYYNIKGEKRALYCSDHREDNMINVKSKTCIYEGCKKQPSYNIEGETKALYCMEHKKETMVDIRNNRCIYEGCKKQPTCNIEGDTKALFCAEHKKDTMVDIRNKRCIYEGCKKHPNYNTEGETIALYCLVHRKENMIDIRNKRCKSVWCYTFVANKYDGYCLFCFTNLFPDKPVSRNYKTKEYAVVEYVKNTFADMNWIADKKVYDGCSKRRPDLFADLGYQILIVEIDENQHTDYDCSCENKRLMEISKDVNHRPIVFIRFNPDEYTSADKNITSCWNQNKHGIMVIKKSKVAEWESRLNSLKEQISYWIDAKNKTEKTIEVVELFYDC